MCDLVNADGACSSPYQSNSIKGHISFYSFLCDEWTTTSNIHPHVNGKIRNWNISTIQYHLLPVS